MRSIGSINVVAWPFEQLGLICLTEVLKPASLSPLPGGRSQLTLLKNLPVHDPKDSDRKHDHINRQVPRGCL